METFGQPGHQTRLGAGQVDACHADLGESEFPGQRLNTNHEWMAADHLPIVETQDAVRVWHTEEDTAAFAQ
ncbi:MAG: tRNA (adenosine(37)-N6)-threonylcarbamoyltransferase complex ATPase subunit type 1 TsaE, partial [Variovorax sp.]